MANISSAQMNRPTTPLQANSNIITSNGSANQSGTNNSIRLLAGSHNGQQLTCSSVAASAVNTLNSQGSSSTSSASSTTSNPSSVNNNLSFFQANPHLLNAAALHSTLFTQPSVNSNTVVFKEPLHVQQSNDKRSNRLVFESASHNKDLFLQPDSAKLDSLTPCSTPNQKRKDTNRRRSNLFTVRLLKIDLFL
jgi:hypothetical protein